jgi:hypothetical protein
MRTSGHKLQADELPKAVPESPLTTAELGRRIGMSPTFIREEIHAGHLRAIVVGHGRKRVFRILPDEARRYMRELGVR